MRHFADTCRTWAAAARNASSRQLMENEARHWAGIADAIDRHIVCAKVELVDDLRVKLN